MFRYERILLVFCLLAIGLISAPAAAQTRRGQPAAVITSTVKINDKIAHNLVPPNVPTEADTYEAALRAQFKPAKRVVPQLIAAAARALAGPAANPRVAAQTLREAVFADPANAAAWTLLAEALLAVTPEPARPAEKFELLVAASSAGWRAYERAIAAPEQARALAVLSTTMQRRNFWRPAINDLKAARAVENTPARSEALEALIAEHGFRILDTKVDSDAVTPRACVQFSEPLATGAVDFSSFVTVDGHAPAAVTTDPRQLCVDGLKHGEHYRVQLRAGLPSDIDEALIKTVALDIYVRDRAASVRAAGRAYVLPRIGQQGIPLTTVNTEAVTVEIFRIGTRNLLGELQSGDFQRQISTGDLERLRDRSGESVYKGELTTPAPLNTDVTTAFPVGEALPKLQPGVYVLSATVANTLGGDQDADARRHASQWFVVSDLGMTAYSGRDGVHGFIRSLATAEPALGVRVRLIARNNEVLGEAMTDTRGYVHFDAGLKQGEGGQAPAYLSAEKKSADAIDYAFLDLAAAAFDFGDRGVSGRDAPGPVDAFTFAERGVYRPGETVHLTSLVRDAGGKAVKVPVTLIVTRPDGVEYKRMVLADDAVGARSVDVGLSSAAATGTWHVRVHTDPKADAVSSTAFLVEDFVPERLDMTLTAVTPALDPALGGTVRVDGKYLYGPPAANLAVEGEIVVKPAAKESAALTGYRFGRADEKIAPARKTFEALPETDASGTALLPITLPPIDRTQRTLEADVIVRLRESGGRTIERKISLPVAPSGPRIGIKPLFGAAVGDAQAAEGETVHFATLLLAPDGTFLPAPALTWNLLRLEQRWQWYKHDNEWTYDVATATRRVASGTTLPTEAGDAATKVNPADIASKVEWGRYRLEVSTADHADTAGPILSSVEFTAGYWQDETADSPEVLDIALDKATYKVGDTARVHIASKLGGRAEIAILNSGVVAMQEAIIPAGGGDVSVPVGETWGAGAYVTATLFRPLDQAEKRMPGRAIGLKWLAVETEQRTLKVTLEAPEKVRSAAKLIVPIKLAGLQAGEQARVIVHAVDVGILNLTHFETPKPATWFFGQRKLGLEIRDFYSRLIDGMRAERGKLRSGGDGGASDSISVSGSPPVEATLALTSGIVTVAADGTAEVAFDMPDFNGTVRLNAVAWTEARVGSASRDVIVRDPVALTVAAPRFLTLGDEARVQLDLHNVEGPAGDYKINATQLAPDAIGAPRGSGEALRALASDTLTLAEAEKKSAMLSLRPTAVGPLPVEVVIRGPGDIAVKRVLQFDVKPPAGDIRRTTVATLAAGGGKVVLTPDLLDDLIADTARITAHVGPLASLDVPGLLAELDRYPYRCAEQTTSRALPLLSQSDVTRQVALGLGTEASLKERVTSAIERVLAMQDSSGAFGLWGPGNSDLWLTSYVTDFLLRAREVGYPVNPRALGLALDRLGNAVAIEQEFSKGGETRAYALYILARAGRAPVGELRYDVDTRLGKFGSALAQAQLGAALGLTGDRQRAEAAFATAIATLDAQRKQAGADIAYRTDFGSSIRDQAGIVALASELKLAKAETPRLIDMLAQAAAGRGATSTQEQAWLLLAARAIGDQDATMALTVDGVPHIGQFDHSWGASEIARATATIENPADAPTTAVITVTGAALTPEPATAKGLTLKRTYYALDGTKIDLQSASGGVSSVAQNERLVVVLQVEAPDAGGRILLVDRLPAGLEIENPHLVDSGDVKALDWLKTTTAPEMTQFRDDRFLASFDFFGSGGHAGNDGSGEHPPIKTATVAYMVRAVTPGSFIHPAATVEDMYRPDRYARTASGHLTVLAK